jgi:hypothetical protein
LVIKRFGYPDEFTGKVACNFANELNSCPEVEAPVLKLQASDQS